VRTSRPVTTAEEKIMRGAGAVNWGGELLYVYFTTSGSVTRVRLSADDADRLDVIEGRRVTLALPGAEPFDGLLVRVRREPPFVWIELTALAPSVTSRAG
jgi:hypothetical protein